MLKLTGALGAYRVIDDQTSAVVLNAVDAHYVHEAGSPPRLMVEVEGALIDAQVMVSGELRRIQGDGRNTDVTTPDGTPVRNIRSVDIHAGPVLGLGVVTLAEAPGEPVESPTDPSAPEPESPPGPADEPETPAEESAPLESAPADPTDAASDGGSASEGSSSGAEGEAPAPRASRRPRG